MLRKGAPKFKERRARQRQPNVGNLDSDDSTFTDEEIPVEGEGAHDGGDAPMGDAPMDGGQGDAGNA